LGSQSHSNRHCSVIVLDSSLMIVRFISNRLPLWFSFLPIDGFGANIYALQIRQKVWPPVLYIKLFPSINKQLIVNYFNDYVKVIAGFSLISARLQQHKIVIYHPFFFLIIGKSMYSLLNKTPNYCLFKTRGKTWREMKNFDVLLIGRRCIHLSLGFDMIKSFILSFFLCSNRHPLRLYMMRCTLNETNVFSCFWWKEQINQ